MSWSFRTFHWPSIHFRKLHVCRSKYPMRHISKKRSYTQVQRTEWVYTCYHYFAIEALLKSLSLSKSPPSTKSPPSISLYFFPSLSFSNAFHLLYLIEFHLLFRAYDHGEVHLFLHSAFSEHWNPKTHWHGFFLIFLFLQILGFKDTFGFLKRAFEIE